MNKTTTYGARPENLARLLGLGMEAPKALPACDGEQDAGRVLEDWLSAPWPPRRSPQASSPTAARRMYGPPVPLGEALLDGRTEPAVIEAIKAHGKKAAGKEGSQRPAAVAIYYAGIASALVFHGRKISRHSYRGLAEAFDKLMKKEWMTAGLAQLFARAGQLCRDKTERIAGNQDEP